MTERQLIEKAVGLIKLWHNMGALDVMSKEDIERIWKIYYEQSPEMKEIREYLEQG